jgi:hypothetical protein
MNNRMVVTPCTCVSHDDKNGRLKILLELPGVDKKDISLKMRKDSFVSQLPKEKIPSIRAVSCWLMKFSLRIQKPNMKAAFSPPLLR